MDILAHGLWSAVAAVAIDRRRRIGNKAIIAAIGMSVLPDILHVIPVALFAMEGGSLSVLRDYVLATPRTEPVLPEWTMGAAHHLHCIFHSGVVALFLTLLLWRRHVVIDAGLAGWWSHIVIDVLTHSSDFYPSPVFYPISYDGFNGVAWNSALFISVNYGALVIAICWLVYSGRMRKKAKILDERVPTKFP